MGLNRSRGRIPNAIKSAAKRYVDESGHMSYHYACYDTGFGECPDGFDKDEWERHKQDDFMLIDCIVKELKRRGIWDI